MSLILCWSNILAGLGSRDKLLVKRRTRDRMVESSNPGRSGGIIFFSRVNFVCWLLFGVRSTSMLRQWHVKDPGRSAKSAGGRLQVNTHTTLTQRSRSIGWLCHCPGIVWEPIRKRAHSQSSGNTRSQSSQFAEPLWTDPDLKSGISVSDLIST